MNSILECSKRTISKIVTRMKLVCFNCGWGEAVCDLHHILPQSLGGTDHQTNLTYLCPNCHRLAHTGKLSNFKSFEEVVGDSWKNFYNITPIKKGKRDWGGKRILTQPETLKIARSKRTALTAERAKLVIQDLEKSEIDRSQYGWKEKASKILGISPQKVVWYLKKYAPHLLDGATTRASHQLRSIIG